MQKETKKFTTVNNWVCKEFIHCLCLGNFRSCAFLIYNVFSLLDEDICTKMLRYFFDCVPYHSMCNLGYTLPANVRSHLAKLYSIYASNK